MSAAPDTPPADDTAAAAKAAADAKVAADAKPAAATPKKGTIVLPTLTEVYEALGGILALPAVLFLIAFHVGAGYLSYQKYGNIGWATVDFLFAYLYYPYYAFFLAECPVQQSILPGLMGGFKRFFGGRRR